MQNTDKQICLAELAPGGKATIVRIKGHGPFKKRLLEMGFIRGQEIYKVKLAPLADPAEYIIKDYHISLRREEAQEIMVEV
jgi:Fe2+ transport system protein FeoA